ncbi:hypothetical protein CBL_09387 [Carabus blaptoides fortunei]
MTGPSFFGSLIRTGCYGRVCTGLFSGSFHDVRPNFDHERSLKQVRNKKAILVNTLRKPVCSGQINYPTKHHHLKQRQIMRGCVGKSHVGLAQCRSRPNAQCR